MLGQQADAGREAGGEGAGPNNPSREGVDRRVGKKYTDEFGIGLAAYRIGIICP